MFVELFISCNVSIKLLNLSREITTLMEASVHLNPKLRLKNPDPPNPQMQKASVIANEGFAYLVARGGIETG